MGRNTNKAKKQNISSAPKPSPAPTPIKDSPEQALTKLENAAEATATEADLEAMEIISPPPNASSEALIKRATELLGLLEAQKKRLSSAEADVALRAATVGKQERALEDGRSEVAAQQIEFAARNNELLARKRTLDANESDLLQRHAEIVQRELDADAGFCRRNREALAQLEAEGEALRTEFSRHRERMAEERAAFEEDLQEMRNRLTADMEAQRVRDAEAAAATQAAAESALASRESALESNREMLAAETGRLRMLDRQLAFDRELLDEDREAFDVQVAQRSAREVELMAGELRALTERLEAARAERDRLAQQLAEREEADRRFNGETPAEVLNRMRELELEREQLRKELGGRPSAEAAQRLEELVRQKELWDSDRLQLLADLGEARQEAARRRIAVTELEALRDERRALESANALLREANRQLRVEVDALVKGVEGKSPFPSCSQMDTDNKLQSTRNTTDTIRSLKDFAEYIRHRMAWDPNTQKELYYSAEDVRSFLGGLAMSRLHLLQGISGTGKTSLPLAFARAIGAGTAVIEVQAGWRDRQDLIGHFNTFERRFYETEFLQAVYRASTPYNYDIPFIVVLDEMNLSHPEQYFADMLSALEQEQNRQRLILMTASVDPAPRLLTEGGKKLPIPQNIWFIGTANHDETTKDFADKTYDRAHVMELPRHRETFERKDLQPQDPISLKALQSAFNTAVQTHDSDAKKAYNFLQDQLGETLGRRFHIGWGNRLERQLRCYVPVVIASGGTVGEATDHILATKLLRKIRDRYDNRPEDIIALRECIQTRWDSFDKNHEPKRSIALLQQELQRLGHDDV